MIVTKRTEYEVIVKNNKEMISEIENKIRKLRTFDLNALASKGVDVDSVLNVDVDRLTRDGEYVKEKSNELSNVIQSILDLVESSLNN
jgi:hypothetical protein